VAVRLNEENEMKVKITAVPPGGAPTEIRKAWVGLELPLIEEDLEPGVFRSVNGGKPNPRSFGGFPVKTEDAIKVLREAEQEEAAEWWEKWFLETGRTGKTLVFARDCGELVTAEDEAAEEAAAKKRVPAMTASKVTKHPKKKAKA
jgi:hypothetical protein